MKSPDQVVHQMIKHDHFSQWLGIQLIQIDKGGCTLQLTVNNEMLNGFSIAHGGISYSLADSALAFASNAHGFKCVSIETSISHLRKVQEGDRLTANATELHRGKTVGVYDVKITDQEDKLVALFKGIVNISNELW